jgi:L-ascorbate metabolism protein UlaG (beta-lactamase superfamily)
VDLVLCTHGHTDHMDADTLTAIAATAPSCRFVVPAADATRAVDRGAPDNRLIRADAECEIVPFPGLSILPLPSAHETLKTDAAGSHFYLGYVISWRGLTLYHSGDCVPYPGLLERLHAGHVDLALLPVNGRDATRLSNGVPGNFHLREAIALCRDADIPLMLGHHFGLFDFNTIDEPTARQELEAEHAGFDLVEAGVRYDLIRS